MNATLKKYLLVLGVFLSQAAFSDTVLAGQTNVELREINQLSEQGNQAAALDRVNNYLAANPKNAEAMFMRGVILVELGKRDEAIKAFTELTDKYPSLPEPYNNLAVLYADQGQYDKARKALESAIKTHPSYATAHENLGDIYARLASEAYDKALKLDTSNSRAQNKLAMITDLFGGKRAQARPATAVPPAASVSPTPPTNNAAVNPPAAVTPPAATAPVTNNSPVTETKKPVVTEVKPQEIKPAEPKPVESKVAESKPTESKSADSKSSAQLERAVLDAVNAWADAWEAQNVERYLNSYAKDFKTPAGEPRKQWESTRRDRVSRPSKISVKLSNIDVRMEGDSKAKVTFRQAYKATGLDANSNKTLNMVKEGGRWLIQQERVGKF
ncbi:MULTISPECIES: tetratricopeptide repeat protein [unclassified Methylophilus]|uniref:nuclear transport factor 2 family protein n=1 Tax=unclassified Methylophilus TaxID=2630143 RepID=UPI0023B27DE1|nr:tetratricopeptide repeat protein [Methylophilus sp. YYY-1]MDF0378187.1 tetratricopeptide repeat protein [Methylophilus sp. YYY-1]BEV07185.1 tetratricopeptide repeat protein [Methylophilus sp. DW102]